MGLKSDTKSNPYLVKDDDYYQALSEIKEDHYTKSLNRRSALTIAKKIMKLEKLYGEGFILSDDPDVWSNEDTFYVSILVWDGGDYSHGHQMIICKSEEGLEIEW